MAQHNSERNDLSVSWPFTAAGLAITVALSWFCLGFALHDRKPIDDSIEVSGPVELAGHYQVFWILILAAAVLTIGGLAFNRHRARQRLAAQ